jgi:hypothetical protein
MPYWTLNMNTRFNLIYCMCSLRLLHFAYNYNPPVGSVLHHLLDQRYYILIPPTDVVDQYMQNVTYLLNGERNLDARSSFPQIEVCNISVYFIIRTHYNIRIVLEHTPFYQLRQRCGN